MLKTIFYSSYTVVGIIMLMLGLAIGFLLTDFPKIEFDNHLRLYEVINFFLTLCIAISIPFIVKKSIDDKRAIKNFLTEEVKEALKYLTKTKELINTCYSNGAITRQNKDTIIIDFDNLGLKINSLGEQLEISFKNESKTIMEELKETYLLYHRFVTGDELMREGYDKIDLGFNRDYKSHYNKLELQLKKLIHKFHCF
ncbi:MAG TPA: hypothetical protein VKG26_14150 [Bacteroidia bacterium]|nr:hypothetical protein [Bacteroidia bacterium]